jgi:GTPase Era involved in 16S rRNA processing
MSILITRSVQVQATRENIATLATFQDEHANAVSFYFSVPGVHDRSHHEEI